MGQEFGQFIEWDEKRPLDWFLLDYDSHRGLLQYVKKLNHVYKENAPLWEVDYSWEGFKWLVSDDNTNSVAAFERFDADGNSVIAVCNFTPVTREDYRIGLDCRGVLTKLLDSDSPDFGGRGINTQKRVCTKKIPWHGRDNSVSLTLPGFSCLIYKYSPYKQKTDIQKG